MTQIEKLDMILFGLTSAKLNVNVNAQPESGYKMDFICEILNIPLANGEEKILEGILLADEYIEYVRPEYKILINISSKGLDFINKGGYQNLEKDNIFKREKEELEKRLMDSSIDTNRWTKFGILISILISIIALIVAIISLLK